MKEIKFRVWDTIHKRMYYSDETLRVGVLDGEPYLCSASFQFNDFAIEFSNKLISLQFTGLKDKNGKEIYEGDIITYIYSYSEFEINDSEVKEQKIIETIFDISMFMGCESHFDIEVIGNIYKNPEFLK